MDFFIKCPTSFYNQPTIPRAKINGIDNIRRIIFIILMDLIPFFYIPVVSTGILTH